MSSSYSSPLPPCVTPGWNDPPDLSRSGTRPSSNRLMSKHRRPVDPSIQSSTIDSNSFNNLQQPAQQQTYPQHQQNSFGSNYGSVPQISQQVYTPNQHSFVNNTTITHPPNNGSVPEGQNYQGPSNNHTFGAPFYNPNSSSFSGNITSEHLTNSAFQPYHTFQQQQHQEMPFKNKNDETGICKGDDILTSVQRINNHKGNPNGTETVVHSGGSVINHGLLQQNQFPGQISQQQQQQQQQPPYLGHNAMYQNTEVPLENPSNYLIFSPPHAVMSEERRPITQPDPATYIPPKKAAGDVSLSGSQLVAFLIKATLRLPPGETCKGIQLRIENFNQMIQSDSISEACIKKLNFVVDAIDRDMLEDANVFFDQLMLSYGNETGQWGHGLKLLINELKRVRNDRRLGNDS
uniref:SRA1 domain-containing protein n=1 Tax=Strongyloides stercoralis TaxID=6248 RepID=A0A0K0DUP4_STRER